MFRFVYVINGPGEHGKDTFIKYVLEYAGQMELPGFNFSSIDPCRTWVHEKFGIPPADKSETARAHLVAEKKAWMERDPDGPNRYLLDQVAHVTHGIVFLHVREPEQIALLQKMAAAHESGSISIRTGHVMRPGWKVPDNPVDQGTLGTADKPYEYDFYIKNDGSEDDLRLTARTWARREIFTVATCEGISALYTEAYGQGMPMQARR